MRMSLKYGVSAVALLAAVSLVHAQTGERQGGGKEGGALQHQGSAAGAGKEHGTAANTGSEKRGEAERSGQSARKEQNGIEARGGEQGATNERPAQTGRQNSQEETRAQNQRDTKGQRTAKEGQNAGSQESQLRDNAQKEGQRNAQGRENWQRQSNAGGAARRGDAGVNEKARGEQRVNFHVSQPQKAKLHDSLVHDSAIHVYHRSEVNFAINAGERIPDTIELFTPPPEFVEIDPQFNGYMIVALDDEILVVDPETREIVDAIPT